MKPWEYFKWLADLDYTHAGINADYNVCIKDNSIYVSFQQTRDWFDWVLNILFIPIILLIPFSAKNSILHTIFITIACIEVIFLIIFIVKFLPKKPYKAMKDIWKVHFGIALIYGSIRDEVIECVKGLIESGCTDIYVGGWSQGGGVAQMFAEDCYFQFGIKPTLTTFGSLNITYGKKSTQKIADCCKNGSFAYSNGSDVVPHLPFYFLGFRRVLDKHIGEKFNWFKIFGTGKYHSDYGNENLYK